MACEVRRSEAAEIRSFTPLPIVMAYYAGRPGCRRRPRRITERSRGTERKPDGLARPARRDGCRVVPDGDGECWPHRRGTDLPIVSFDLHGNLSEAIKLHRGGIAPIPHRSAEAGLRAASLLVQRGEVRPRTALAKPPVIVNIMVHDTSQEPLKGFMDEVRALEQKPGILAASLLPGFAYADVPQMGPSVVVVAEDEAQAQAEADALAAKLWAARKRLTKQLPDAATAVALAMKEERKPVVLVDTGDNVGGVRRQTAPDPYEMLRQRDGRRRACTLPTRWVSVAAGVGRSGPGRRWPGGQAARLRCRCAAACVSRHDYVEHEVRHGGKRLNHMGLTAGRGAGRNLLVLTSLRHPPFSLGQLTARHPAASSAHLVAKAAIAYKAAYLPVAAR
jgi:hypothetical protein